METIMTTWELWTYDVWGNAEDGWDVNDRTCFEENCHLRLKIERANPGTPGEFLRAAPTDRQIQRLYGLRCRLAVEGDDLHITFDRASDRRPVGEMICVSHKSLSPIREK